MAAPAANDSEAAWPALTPAQFTRLISYGTPVDMAVGDLMFKMYGLSLEGAFYYRHGDRNPGSLTDASNNVRMTTTNAFGFFSFSGVTSGQNVTLKASARGRVFSSKSVQVTPSLAEVDLIATQ